MKYIARLEVDNDILLRGDECITTLDDLYISLVDSETTDIIITREFADKFFTYEALCDFMNQVAQTAPNVHVVVEGTMFNTTLEAVKDIRTYTTPDEFIYALHCNPTRVLSTIRTLCDSYVSAHEESAKASNKIATMLVQLDDAHKENNRLQEENATIMNNLNDVKSSLHALVSRVNYKYEKAINIDEAFVLNENAYNHILYIKEISRVHFVDTLLYYVEEIIKTLYSEPVRSVVIEKYYSYGNEYMYPTHAPSYSSVTYRDVYAGDILMHGFQPKIMRDILRDPNHVHFLIILDRAGYKAPHVTGGNVTTIYTASDLKDVPESIPLDRVISYDQTSLNIPYIENFDALSAEAKIQKYSSMSITKKLINILEESD